MVFCKGHEGARGSSAEIPLTGSQRNHSFPALFRRNFHEDIFSQVERDRPEMVPR
jgi:hypothetical protein